MTDDGPQMPMFFIEPDEVVHARRKALRRANAIALLWAVVIYAAAMAGGIATNSVWGFFGGGAVASLSCWAVRRGR